jgi:hypothetical protein
MPGKGFAALSEDERKQNSSMGGRAAHAAGTAHEFTSEEAKAAGRKGGAAAAHAKRKEEARLRGHAPKGGYSIDSGGERVWDPALPDRPADTDEGGDS